jgi:hypothetical protein
MLQTCTKNLEKETICVEWLNKWKKRLIATSGYPRLQQYANYGHGTDMKDPVGALHGYDQWRLQKLRRLKDQYDPNNWFRWYQPIIEQAVGRSNAGVHHKASL